jgi:hypothetical protein
MSKQTASVSVSAAADQTRVVKKSKNLMKLDVVGVKIGRESRRVRFVAQNKRGGIVICRTKGLPPIRVRCIVLGHRDEFWATVRGTDEVAIAKSPMQAFARGVKQFWA